MKTYTYRQTTYESCLACALLHLCAIKSSPTKELEIWKQGWNFNFLIGQINFMGSKYQQELTAIVENPAYCKSLQQQSNINITFKSKPIDINIIKAFSIKAPLIVYVDSFYFAGSVHAPHFFTILQYQDNHFVVADSQDGKVKLVKPRLLQQSINSLRKRLLFSPVLVYKTKH
jgi:hypothetical protein